jgi:hypothetical protein
MLDLSFSLISSPTTHLLDLEVGWVGDEGWVGGFVTNSVEDTF